MWKYGGGLTNMASVWSTNAQLILFSLFMQFCFLLHDKENEEGSCGSDGNGIPCQILDEKLLCHETFVGVSHFIQQKKGNKRRCCTSVHFYFASHLHCFNEVRWWKWRKRRSFHDGPFEANVWESLRLFCEDQDYRFCIKFLR